jgi:hypothetical protein
MDELRDDPYEEEKLRRAIERNEARERMGLASLSVDGMEIAGAYHPDARSGECGYCTQYTETLKSCVSCGADRCERCMTGIECRTCHNERAEA